MSQPTLAIVLTARMESERRPGKVMVEIAGRPLIEWQALRLKGIPNSTLIIATTEREADDVIWAWATRNNLPCYRGVVDDVVKRVDDAVNYHAPYSDFVMRGLGDCPFIDPTLIARSVEVMHRTNAQAFQWRLPPGILPVYGAREFPYATQAWRTIAHHAKGDEREHVDMYYHRNRSSFRVVYHEAPSPVYFRPYRLEVDTDEDIELMRLIQNGVGLDAGLPDVIRFLDSFPELVATNATIVEKTGPETSYTPAEALAWWEAMYGQPSINWDDTHTGPHCRQEGKEVRCGSGACLIGWAMRTSGTQKQTLYLHNGTLIQGRASLPCSCGAGKEWYPG